MASIEHTPEQKKDASELLLYEVTMLHDLSCRMESLLKNDAIMGRALLEAFSIHTKVLYEFFYSENADPNTVHAADFFESNSAWKEIRQPETELLGLAALRIGKEVASFKYGRREVVPILKGWDYCQIAGELHSAFTKFVHAAPVAALGPRCSEFKHHDGSSDE